jgi:hypothetical protein
MKVTLTCLLILVACSPDPRDREGPKIAHGDSSPTPTTRAPLPDTAGSKWLALPSDSTSALNARTTEAELRRRYGAQAVDSIRVELGEGETAPGTVLFSADSMRRAEILWQDTVGRSHPSRAIVRGRKSLWQVGRGITLGTTLQELERLNGRPFTLAGFGWDYGGVVTDWGGGALDSMLTGVKLYLDPGPSQYTSSDYSKVLGDRDYTSSLPPMQRLAPRVAQIFIDFQ